MEMAVVSVALVVSGKESPNEVVMVMVMVMVMVVVGVVVGVEVVLLLLLLLVVVVVVVVVENSRKHQEELVLASREWTRSHVRKSGEEAK
jgi:hypothetical protein